eukprot:1537685-Ditylum_brightwellii.AAC.1
MGFDMIDVKTINYNTCMEVDVSTLLYWAFEVPQKLSICWRLLSMYKLEPNLLNVLIGQIVTLSLVYHKPAEAFAAHGHGYGLAADMGNLLEGIDDNKDEEHKGKNDIDEGGE